jgi:uncharacterized integral membrane protein (TIGR00698 family)
MDEPERLTPPAAPGTPAPWHPRRWLGRLRELGPGLLVCVVIALASTFLSEHYGGPQLLYALLIGLAFHFIHANPQARPGIEFCGRTVLRFGVALLGARITLDQVSALGVEAGLAVAASLVLTILLGVWLARRLGLSREEGLISGGSVAICGASAALAISAVLPQTRANERFTLLAVVSVTVLSTVAMVLYPLVIQVLDLAAGPAGVFLGGTIHDVAQVVAAGVMISPQAGDTATLVKLFRVMLLMPVVMVIAFLYRHHASATAPAGSMPLLPGFLLAFMVLMLLSSSGLVPPRAVTAATDLSRACLVLAIAAAGIKTSMEDLLQLGWRPIQLFLAETVFIALSVLLAIFAFGLGGA